MHSLERRCRPKKVDYSFLLVPAATTISLTAFCRSFSFPFLLSGGMLLLRFSLPSSTSR